MPTLEEIYKAKGYTDADLEVIKPLLTDSKFRGVLEGELTSLGETVRKYEDENKNWADWHKNTAEPTLSLYEKERADALSENASLKERLRLAEEGGFVPRRSEPATPAPTVTPTPTAATMPQPFDASKFLTMDQASEFAKREALAIAKSGNMLEEHRHLTGKSLIEYEAKTADGRTLKGLEALLEESRAANTPLDVYTAKKFDYDGKRAAIADAQRKAAEDAIRADERAKVMSTYGQVGNGPMMPSRQPFVPRSSGENAKQPWERGTDRDRTNARVANAMAVQSRAVN